MSAPERPVTKAELAAHYGCSSRTIGRWMSRRLIPYVKLGRPIFYLSEVDAALRSHGLIKSR